MHRRFVTPLGGEWIRSPRASGRHIRRARRYSCQLYVTVGCPLRSAASVANGRISIHCVHTMWSKMY